MPARWSSRMGAATARVPISVDHAADSAESSRACADRVEHPFDALGHRAGQSRAGGFAVAAAAELGGQARAVEAVAGAERDLHPAAQSAR